MRVFRLSEKDIETIFLAILYAKNWNDSLVDAHSLPFEGEIDRPFCNKCRKENELFDNLAKKLNGLEVGSPQRTDKD